MGHIVFNRIKSGKTLEASKATQLLLDCANENVIYVIAKASSRETFPKVHRVSIQKLLDFAPSGIPNAGKFCVIDASGKYTYNEYYEPENCFPCDSVYVWKKHKSEILAYCGDYEAENDDHLEGFLASAFGTITNPVDETHIGFGSIWYTTNKSEADALQKLIVKHLKN